MLVNEITACKYEETSMQVNMLTKSISTIVLVGMASSAFAAGQLAEKTGDTLTNVSDSIYTSLTGKSVNAVQVNHPVNLYDYSEASSAYEDAYINGSLNVNDAKGANTTYDAKLGVDYDKVITSPDTNTKYKAALSGTASDDGLEKGTKDANGNDAKGKVESYIGSASITHDRYFDPAASKAFWFGQGEVMVKDEDANGDAGIDDPKVTLTAGVGYGRVVNVTPMAQAMRLVEALVENGSLKQVPSAATYNKIAQIISVKDTYQNNNPERYAQYWISDIEKALGVDLGAAGSIRAYDVLQNEKVSTRKYGWDVRAGATVVAHDFDGESGKPGIKLEGNYYYPISNKTQFSNEAQLTTTFDDGKNDYTFANAMGLTYELSDRVDWENKWNLIYNKNDGSSDVITNRLSSAFLYEISNSLDYEAKVNLDHTKVKDGDSTYNKGLFMGVKYRLK